MPKVEVRLFEQRSFRIFETLSFKIGIAEKISDSRVILYYMFRAQLSTFFKHKYAHINISLPNQWRDINQQAWTIAAILYYVNGHHKDCDMYASRVSFAYESTSHLFKKFALNWYIAQTKNFWLYKTVFTAFFKNCLRPPSSRLHSSRQYNCSWSKLVISFSASNFATNGTRLEKIFFIRNKSNDWIDLNLF